MLFSDLFKIIKNNNEFSFEIMLCDECHPIFKAHFPKNPILPGFIQIDISSYLFNLNFTKIKKAKFLDTLLPNDSVVINLYKEKKRVELIKNSKKVSEFIYE
ncbi:hypothetical protein [Halarcobacter ebronensis]|uniref:ApeI dehydratase-like domain-containing protein n=1 Tax=Halarcobacter ebronensis TaxID=1462615 RepID=A0A4Q1AR72_9BACT|nr:hypothetical protein [Halarcobacter ebronensis]QKF83503.1 hypothetical protein AEBR_3057 [Halarcobacter ebronensis]RXK08297.1 hypothetical protein CRV07_00385 [Halarcobacter ebronensis]